MHTGIISKIQNYSTKDGPGIRSTVFCIGCNLNCKWCANPETISPNQKVMFYSSRCNQCGECISKSNGAISLSNNSLNINREKILDWAPIIESCPFNAFEKIGEIWNTHDLANQLLRDKVFYEISHGGVTFSGGEAALQADFIIETAFLLRKEGIHIALDTAGNIPWHILSKVLEEIDLVLFDIKCFDSFSHLHCTGSTNNLILENAKKIAELGKDMWIRLIVVPGLNSDLNDIRNRFKFIRSLGDSVKRVELLKYHNLGVSKYAQLGLEYTIEKNLNFPDDLLHDILRISEQEGIKIFIEN